MSGYVNFASVYDELMSDVDYSARTQYLLKLFKKYDKLPTLLLDFACGTGSFSVQFAKRGVEVVGVDISPEMLSIAKNKAYAQGVDVVFLCQSGENLDLYGTVNGAVCCLDSVNHIVNSSELLSTFKKIALFLEQGRLFIFDVNTEYKHKSILANNSFVLETDNVFCAWQNFLQEDEKTVDICLDFFVEQNGLYNRLSDSFSERAYSLGEIKDMLQSSGFELVDVLGDNTFAPPKMNSERNIYIAKRI